MGQKMFAVKVSDDGSEDYATVVLEIWEDELDPQGHPVLRIVGQANMLTRGVNDEGHAVWFAKDWFSGKREEKPSELDFFTGFSHTLMGRGVHIGSPYAAEARIKDGGAWGPSADAMARATKMFRDMKKAVDKYNLMWRYRCPFKQMVEALKLLGYKEAEGCGYEW